MVQGVFLFHDQQYFQNMVGVLEFVTVGFTSDVYKLTPYTDLLPLF